MNQTSQSDIQEMLINPFYAISFAEHLFVNHDNLTAKEDWILLNAHLIKDVGTRGWPAELLDILSKTREAYEGHDILNPALAVNISIRLRGSHDPIVTRDQWLAANEKLINELGAEAWLGKLLVVLETGGEAELAI